MKTCQTLNCTILLIPCFGVCCITEVHVGLWLLGVFLAVGSAGSQLQENVSRRKFMNQLDATTIRRRHCNLPQQPTWQQRKMFLNCTMPFMDRFDLPQQRDRLQSSWYCCYPQQPPPLQLKIVLCSQIKCHLCPDFTTTRLILQRDKPATVLALLSPQQPPQQR